ncbi:MAG: hypothetical protein RMI85_06130 [Candidatus Korarchaeum sp.]|nr:hypothetical protein [Candidatus Korarchaeum sp.]
MGVSLGLLLTPLLLEHPQYSLKASANFSVLPGLWINLQLWFNYTPFQGALMSLSETTRIDGAAF